jgi:YbgC/YbaW family acyl-CoA thioester hydrolase
MARLSIDLPKSFLFSTSIPVRITDLNYGGHVGNDTVLSIIHEGRMQFLKHHGYSETDLAGTGMIMGDVSIAFKNELFYGDVVQISVAVTEMSKVTFDLVYKLEKESGGKTILVAQAKTGMVCYNYQLKKVAALPEEVKSRFSAG